MSIAQCSDSRVITNMCSALSNYYYLVINASWILSGDYKLMGIE